MTHESASTRDPDTILRRRLVSTAVQQPGFRALLVLGTSLMRAADHSNLTLLGNSASLIRHVVKVRLSSVCFENRPSRILYCLKDASNFFRRLVTSVFVHSEIRLVFFVAIIIVFVLLSEYPRRVLYSHVHHQTAFIRDAVKPYAFIRHYRQGVDCARTECIAFVTESVGRVWKNSQTGSRRCMLGKPLYLHIAIVSIHIHITLARAQICGLSSCVSFYTRVGSIIVYYYKYASLSDPKFDA